MTYDEASAWMFAHKRAADLILEEFTGHPDFEEWELPAHERRAWSTHMQHYLQLAGQLTRGEYAP